MTLTQVPESQRQIITNLMQLYKYDFSEFDKYDFSEFAEVGSRYGEVGPDGRFTYEVGPDGPFTYEGLDSHWREDGRVPLTVEAGGRLAGFVLVNRWSALNRVLDHSVAEFFVLRKYRRIGVGSRAARLLFERWPGRWEVAVAGYNKRALSFLRKAIRASVDGPVEEYAGDATLNGERWLGTVPCFDSRTRKS